MRGKSCLAVLVFFFSSASFALGADPQLSFVQEGGIAQQGGKVGPDLNAPQSVTEYRSPEMLKAFIRKPSQFRYTHMPDHADLSDADLDNLLDYLRHMANQRRQAIR